MGLPEISFIMFMLVGFVCAWEIKTRYEILYWLFSILIPLIMLIILVYAYSQGSGYRAGQATAQCLISTVATMIMMIIVFYARPKKKKK